MAKKTEFGPKPGHEFLDEEDRATFVASLERELQGAINRDDEAYADNVRDELRRLGELKAPAKAAPKDEPARPEAKAK